MVPRFLFLTVPLGMGGIRSADAIAESLVTLEPTAHICQASVLDYTNDPIRERSGKAYLEMIERAPHMIGYFYDLAEVRWNEGASFPHVMGYFHDLFGHTYAGEVSDPMERVVQQLDLDRLRCLLIDERPDVIVNTHYFAARLVASLRKSGSVCMPQCTVTHDFEVIRRWIQNPCEHYFVAARQGVQALSAWGVPESAVTVSGIPIRSEFLQTISKVEAREKLGLSVEEPVVLLMAGGLALGPIGKMYRNILAGDRGLQIVAITGRNEKLRNELENIPVPRQHRSVVLGFTDQVDHFLAAADLIVTKPGGLTSSEALARGIPMVIVNPIPGQESRNADYLIEYGAAVKVNNLDLLTYKISELLAQPDRLAAMRASGLRISKPDAAHTIAQKLLLLAHEFRSAS